METQNHTSCKCNYTLLFFLHLRGTSHIAGSCLSIGKAGGYSKDQDKKNYGSMNKGRPWKEILAGTSRMFVSL